MGPILRGGVHPGYGVNNADGRNTVDVGGAAVAQPRAFGDEPFQALLFAPRHGVLYVADKVMARAGGAGKARDHRHPGLPVAQVVKGGQTVEFYHPGRPARRAKVGNQLQNDRGFARGGRPCYDQQFDFFYDLSHYSFTSMGLIFPIVKRCSRMFRYCEHPAFSCPLFALLPRCCRKKNINRRLPPCGAHAILAALAGCHLCMINLRSARPIFLTGMVRD